MGDENLKILDNYSNENESIIEDYLKKSVDFLVTYSNLGISIDTFNNLKISIFNNATQHDIIIKKYVKAEYQDKFPATKKLGCLLYPPATNNDEWIILLSSEYNKTSQEWETVITHELSHFLDFYLHIPFYIKRYEKIDVNLFRYRSEVRAYYFQMKRAFALSSILIWPPETFAFDTKKEFSADDLCRHLGFLMCCEKEYENNPLLLSKVKEKIKEFLYDGTTPNDLEVLLYEIFDWEEPAIYEKIDVFFRKKDLMK